MKYIVILIIIWLFGCGLDTKEDAISFGHPKNLTIVETNPFNKTLNWWITDLESRKNIGPPVFSEMYESVWIAVFKDGNTMTIATLHKRDFGNELHIQNNISHKNENILDMKLLNVINTTKPGSLSDKLLYGKFPCHIQRLPILEKYTNNFITIETTSYEQTRTPDAVQINHKSKKIEGSSLFLFGK